MADNSTHIGFCPHCGNKVPQRIVLRHIHDSPLYDTDGKQLPEPGPEFEAIVTVCQTCGEVLLYDGFSEQEFGEWPPMQYPQPPYLSESVPKKISEIYAEASRVKQVSPNAFAVLLRRALETVCADRGIETGSLSRRLKTLADRGEVPPLLAEVSDVVRILGNVGAHASDTTIRPQDTWALDEFFRAIIEYVYIGPERLKKYKVQLDRLQRAGRTSSEPAT